MDIPTIDDVRAAAQRIAPFARETPVLTDDGLDDRAGAALFFKCEMFQPAGAFKFRGACNAVFSLSDDVAARGVATHSSGNHAAALALAAKLRGIAAHVVMPSNAPEAKRRAVIAYGGRVVPCDPTLAARETTAAKLVAETGATLIHPFDDPRVIAGQGTLALEFHRQIPNLGAVVAPVSGGGLTSGIAIATAAVSRATAVVAAEPELADDAAESLKAGRLMPASRSGTTVADGLRATLSERTLTVLSRHGVAVVTVSEADILAATRLIWERLRVVAEPSAAVPLAAVLRDRGRFMGQRVGVVVSGGNLDLDRLPWA